MRDQVELIDSRIRIRTEGHDAVARAIGATYGREFASVESALGIDDYIVIETNEAGDITSIERDTFDDSFAGDPIWQAIAPWVDPGDYLTYRETHDGSTYRVVFDGRGGFDTRAGRVAYDT